MRRGRRIIHIATLAGLIALSGPVVNADPQPQTDHRETLEKLELFGQIFSVVRDNYVEDVEDKTLIEDALNGALLALDPHSIYVPKTDYVEQQKSSRREYGGLGIEVTLENGLVKVNYANQDAPAARAGIKSGDYITAVEGEKVLGKTLDAAVEGMRGLAGDPITVTVLSPGKDPRDITLVREVVQGRAVRHRVEQGLAYIYVETFNNNRLDKDFKHALTLLKSELGGRLPGIIMDLRGNRGGLLDQSVNISSNFLDGGEVLSARGRKPEDTERYNAEPGELFPGVPLVILINSGSASAAEIVAGAIQDRGRGIIIGRRSFGKGSVQSVIPLLNGGGALRMTTQRYFTPSGKSIQGRGIMPDILVALRPDTGDIRKRFREDSLPNALMNEDVSDFQENYGSVDYPPDDWPEDQDYQLRKAVDVIKSSRYRTFLAQKNSRQSFGTATP